MTNISLNKPILTLLGQATEVSYEVIIYRQNIGQRLTHFFDIQFLTGGPSSINFFVSTTQEISADFVVYTTVDAKATTYDTPRYM